MSISLVNNIILILILLVPFSLFLRESANYKVVTLMKNGDVEYKILRTPLSHILFFIGSSVLVLILFVTTTFYTQMINPTPIGTSSNLHSISLGLIILLAFLLTSYFAKNIFEHLPAMAIKNFPQSVMFFYIIDYLLMSHYLMFLLKRYPNIVLNHIPLSINVVLSCIIVLTIIIGYLGKAFNILPEIKTSQPKAHLDLF